LSRRLLRWNVRPLKTFLFIINLRIYLAAYDVLLGQDETEAFSKAVQRQKKYLQQNYHGLTDDFVAELFGVLISLDYAVE
jgi:hypothetical protein